MSFFLIYKFKVDDFSFLCNLVKYSILYISLRIYFNIIDEIEHNKQNTDRRNINLLINLILFVLNKDFLND